MPRRLPYPEEIEDDIATRKRIIAVFEGWFVKHPKKRKFGGSWKKELVELMDDFRRRIAKLEKELLRSRKRYGGTS